MAYTLQLKRRVNCENKGAALAGLKAYLATAAVGEPAIATYGGGEDIDTEKVLLGIKGVKNYTIFDADTIPSEVQAAIDAAKQEVQTAIEEEESARTDADKVLQAAIDKVEASVGLATDGSHVTTSGNYTSGASTVVGEIAALNAQVKKNTDAIATETSRATAEETRITDTVIGEDQLEEGKSVMDVVLENEETTQQAIEKLATATGVLSGEEIKYTAPTVSGEFSSTTSIMDMLNKIDEKWNTIDCGTY